MDVDNFALAGIGAEGDRKIDRIVGLEAVVNGGDVRARQLNPFARVRVDGEGAPGGAACEIEYLS